MLFLVPFYLIFSLYAIYQIMKLYKGKKKWRVFLLLAFLFYLPLGWDVLLGRTYFHYLCNKDGGIHIYEAVELGAEYWNEDGSPKFYGKSGGLDESMFDGLYERKRVSEKYSRKWLFNGIRRSSQLCNLETGKIFGEIISYNYLGGWVFNTWQPFGPSGKTCPHYSDLEENPQIIKWNGYTNKQYGDYLDFTSYIFLRKHTTGIK